MFGMRRVAARHRKRFERILEVVFAFWGYIMAAGFWKWQLYDANKIAKRIEQSAMTEAKG
jgi:hypothetical protein